MWSDRQNVNKGDDTSFVNDAPVPICYCLNPVLV